jgi:Xaa-Pro aminopeptidase
MNLHSPAARRADIDAKQAAMVPILESLEVEGIYLFAPAHVAWFTAGMNVRGLIADSERPGVYTNGRQRWVICSNVDSQRLFDEELDQLGFQLKEWCWEMGRFEFLTHLISRKSVAADWPIPNVRAAGERVRPLLRGLSSFEQEQYRALGRAVVHAVEATARNFARKQSEEEIAGQLGHRLLHHGIEPIATNITADGRGSRYRRAGAGSTPAVYTAVIQATGQMNGLFVTCSRSVSFGPPPDEFRHAHDIAMRQAALLRSLARPGSTIGTIGQASRAALAQTPYEFDWRLSPPGYGTGRFAAEAMRRGGVEEPLVSGTAVVWQARVGAAASVDTIIVTPDEPIAVTPIEHWPVKRIIVGGGSHHELPDILVRDE